jgi:hypothetical protein
MHLFSENLAIEVSGYYKNLALGHGVVPEVFTMVNAEGEQYLFFVSELRMDEEDTNKFLAYIVKEHEAVTYAKGTLVLLEDDQELIEFAVIDRDDEDGIVCSAELKRDDEDKPVSLSEFEKMLAPRKKIYFGFYYDPVEIPEDELEDFEDLWGEMKSKILRRVME